MFAQSQSLCDFKGVGSFICGHLNTPLVIVDTPAQLKIAPWIFEDVHVLLQITLYYYIMDKAVGI